MRNAVVRIIEFDAGHRVHGHESKCATMHGHRYKVEIHARGKLDDIGRVIDFSVIKDAVKGWIDTFWDHNTLVYKNDKETIKALKMMPRKKEPFICDWNPTAENMATYLLETVCPHVLMGRRIDVYKVVLWETPNCFAKAVK